MKEDILEQLVDDYLQASGYFTRHNVKFFLPKEHRRKGLDGNHSDIDVLGIHPKKTDFDHVWVVSCKSWQSGFKVAAKLREIEERKIVSGRDAWRFFRELAHPQWAQAFMEEIETLTGTRKFTYITAVTRIDGSPKLWEEHEPFRNNLEGNPIKLIELSELLAFIRSQTTTTVASSTIGRVIQLIKASEKGKPALAKALDLQLPADE